jgi:streptogramin lyase
MTAAPDGTVYFTDNGDLRKLTPDGAVVTLATGLRERADQWVGGVWLDAQGRISVALWGGRMVKRFDPASGRTEVVARSPAPWGPSGGLTAPNGDLWLLETAEDNTVRVRRIAPDGRERIF